MRFSTWIWATSLTNWFIEENIMAPNPANVAACGGPAVTPARMTSALRATPARKSVSAYTVAPAFDHLANTAPAPAAQGTPGALVRVWRHIVAVFAPRPYGAWTDAMTELQHLDGDTLRDVGAPPWLMHQIEMQREQDARSLRMLHHL